jgi:sulfur-carrier protein adenylyltransferase/sulfurtransferase
MTEIPEVSVVEAQSRLAGANPPRLIDVRELEEYEIARIPGAELVPLSQWPAIVAEKLPDPGQALLIHCHHGGRSGNATEFLLRNGYSDVTNVAGGIDAWSLEIDPSIPRY